MRGGAVMGIGQALLEASATDPRTARLLNPGLNEYLIPTTGQSCMGRSWSAWPAGSSWKVECSTSK
jgi:Molybdopterin-binding domain of aldehyde dehydrogenase